MSAHQYPDVSAAGVHPVHFLADQVTVPDHLGTQVSIPQEAMFTTEPPGAPAPRVVTSQTGVRDQSTVDGDNQQGEKYSRTSLI